VSGAHHTTKPDVGDVGIGKSTVGSTSGLRQRSACRAPTSGRRRDRKIDGREAVGASEAHCGSGPDVGKASG